MAADPRERWNHHNHYHEWLLRHLPPSCDRALDVGCGQGFFAARLASVAAHVDAVDVDRATLDLAARLHPAGRVSFRAGDFLAMGLPAGGYDVVASIAALHHMEVVGALREMRRLLRPGGRLAVLGLYRARTPPDYATAGLAMVPNWIRRQLVARIAGGSIDMAAPARTATASLAEIRSAAEAVLPGARIHRHLYWRYSLFWRSPVG